MFNPHPDAWKMIEGMNFSKARKYLRSLGLTKGEQNVIIKQAIKNKNTFNIETNIHKWG